MNKLVVLCSFVMIANLLASCTASPLGSTSETSSQQIEPGDRVGGFLVTTAKAEEETFIWQMANTAGNTPNEYATTVQQGTKVNPCLGIYRENDSENLDDLWSELNYELYIEGRPVHLESFGTVESKHAILGVMRHWNVVLIADKPGKITVHEVGKFKDEVIDDTTIYTVSPPT